MLGWYTEDFALLPPLDQFAPERDLVPALDAPCGHRLSPRPPPPEQDARFFPSFRLRCRLPFVHADDERHYVALSNQGSSCGVRFFSSSHRRVPFSALPSFVGFNALIRCRAFPRDPLNESSEIKGVRSLCAEAVTPRSSFFSITGTGLVPPLTFRTDNRLCPCGRTCFAGHMSFPSIPVFLHRNDASSSFPSARPFPRVPQLQSSFFFLKPAGLTDRFWPLFSLLPEHFPLTYSFILSVFFSLDRAMLSVRRMALRSVSPRQVLTDRFFP